MQKKLFENLTISILILLSLNLFGQETLSLHHRTKTSKVKELSTDLYYTIITKDSTYSKRKIIGATSDALLVSTSILTKDSVRKIKKYANPNANDTSYSPKYAAVAVCIPFKDVKYLERDLFRNKTFLEPIKYFALGGLCVAALSPVVTLASDLEAGTAVFKTACIILGTTVPVLFIGTRKTKYDMQYNWYFVGYMK